MFVVLALVMAFSMPFILPGLDELSEGKRKHITKYALIAVGTFIFGVFVCIAVFGVFGRGRLYQKTTACSTILSGQEKEMLGPCFHSSPHVALHTLCMLW